MAPLLWSSTEIRQRRGLTCRSAAWPVGTRDPRVLAAIRAVPRHAFVPGASLADAYNPDLAVITKRNPAGAALSCASVPYLVAAMLDQLDVHDGHRVFEAGAGTGWNAALLATIAGPGGHVSTIDIFSVKSSVLNF